MEYLRLKCDKCGWDAKKDLQIPVTFIQIEARSLYKCPKCSEFLHVIENPKWWWHYPTALEEFEKRWRPPLIWTKEKPTEPGKYLLKWDECGTLIEGFALVYKKFHCLMVRIHGPNYSSNLAVEVVSGEWAGPIHEPLEPVDFSPGKTIEVDQEDQKICGNCGYWGDERTKLPGGKRSCHAPLAEGETYASLTGYSKENDTCSRWKPIISDEKMVTESIKGQIKKSGTGIYRQWIDEDGTTHVKIIPTEDIFK